MVFISLEDETGIANAVVQPDLFEQQRLTITQENVLYIRGPMQARRGLPMVHTTQIERLPGPSKGRHLTIFIEADRKPVVNC